MECLISVPLDLHWLSFLEFRSTISVQVQGNQQIWVQFPFTAKQNRSDPEFGSGFILACLSARKTQQTATSKGANSAASQAERS